MSKTDRQYLPYSNESTSKAAAESMRKQEPADRHVVFHFIKSRGKHGATDDEIELYLGLKHQTASARRRGLVLNQKVVPAGIMRKTRSGRSAIVWVVSPTAICTYEKPCGFCQ